MEERSCVLCYPSADDSDCGSHGTCSALAAPLSSSSSKFRARAEVSSKVWRVKRHLKIVGVHRQSDDYSTSASPTSSDRVGLISACSSVIFGRAGEPCYSLKDQALMCGSSSDGVVGCVGIPIDHLKTSRPFARFWQAVSCTLSLHAASPSNFVSILPMTTCTFSNEAFAFWEQQISDFRSSALDNYIAANSSSMSGGLLMIWNPALWTLVSFNTGDSFISVNLKFNMDDCVLTFTGVYGPPQRNESRSLIHNLYHIINGVFDLHILGGDFNLTKGNYERHNCSRDAWDSRLFSRFIADSGLNDIQISRVTYTWTNNKILLAFAKLDRILISPLLANKCPLLRIKGGSRRLSDHNPRILNFRHSGPKMIKPFRIEISWFKQIEFARVIKESLKTHTLDSSRTGGILYGWIKAWKILRRTIKDWALLKQKSFNFERKLLEGKIFTLSHRLEAEIFNLSDMVSLKAAKEDLEKLYSSKDQYCASNEGAKKRWINEGDWNTKYFQQCASNRRRLNWIGSLNTDQGPTSNQEMIANCFRAHFLNFLGVLHSPLLQITWSEILPPRPDLSDLDAPFSASEVDQVIKFMKNNKSPGPDGIPMEFYKAFWNDLGPLITKILNDLLLQPIDLQRINSAFIILIPKKEGANTTNDSSGNN
ncbi:hypothetical protein Cni_G06611 [Canna indica]|uniref:Reverse transcriptase n=1 Tax=Canna indica TaxID=4628 RepID=A0AAQ3JYV1_9LILI|nr:hypothetical protein Cni_G06611 [Canna indica]